MQLFNNRTNINNLPNLESSNNDLYLQEEEYDNIQIINDYEKDNLYLDEEFEDDYDYDYDYDLIEGNDSVMNFSGLYLTYSEWVALFI